MYQETKTKRKWADYSDAEKKFIVARGATQFALSLGMAYIARHAFREIEAVLLDAAFKQLSHVELVLAIIDHVALDAVYVGLLATAALGWLTFRMDELKPPEKKDMAVAAKVLDKQSSQKTP